MVKGLSRRIVWVRSPDPQYFEEAIFIISESANAKGFTEAEILKEAEAVAANYMRRKERKLFHELPSPVFAVFGAAITGIIWLVTALV